MNSTRIRSLVAGVVSAAIALSLASLVDAHADGGPRASGGVVIRVTGDLIGEAARVSLVGVTDQARGHRERVMVTGTRTISGLPTGRYRVAASVITNGPRSAAASQPVQDVVVRAGERDTVSFHFPPPPRLPRNFSGKGRYIVRDLGLEVSFTWTGRDGDMQMVAGGPGQPIYFTNVIKDHYLYTKTYTWPGLSVHTCERVGRLDRAWFNESFRTARYVGPVTLEGRHPRRVNHFRVGWVVPPGLPSGLHLRLGVASADIFVDQRDSGVFWNVQHFGIQNLYDPQLDEWIQLRTFSKTPGTVRLPAGCG